MVNYFDFLPYELNNIIASYLILLKSEDTESPSQDFRDALEIATDVLHINNYILLYNTTYPEYVEVTRDELSVKSDFYIINEYDNNSYKYLMFYLHRIIINNGTNKGNFEIEELRANNIYYRYLFKQQFSQLYQQMKYFDLYQGGTAGSINFVYLTFDDYMRKRKSHNYSGWEGLLYRFNHIENRDFLSELLINFMKTGQLPVNYVYDSLEMPIAHSDFIVYLFYAMTLNNNFKFELQLDIVNYFLLLSAYWYNTKIFDKIKERVSNNAYRRILNSDDDAVQAELNIPYGNDEDATPEDIPLVEYIKKRARMN